MNWIRLWGERLGFWRCCWLEDHDGELNCRVARKLPMGRWLAHRHGFGIADVMRMPDGKLRGPCYVHGWFWNDEIMP